MSLLDEAIAAGARQDKACEVLGLDARTVQRWRARPGGGDQRNGPTTRPANALSDSEWATIRALSIAPEFDDLSPHQLVAKLADMGMYVASERSFYRELSRARLLAHRERSRPRTHKKPEERVATGPNQAWAWDITYLPAAVVGTYHFLYAVLDVWSRKIVAWEVHETQSDELSAPLIAAACTRESVQPGDLLLHADNGAAMKGKTMLAKLEELGVMPSFSRPRVSDDNPFPEALFRTLKYRPSYPDRRFTSLDEARRWVERFVAWYNDDHQHSAIRFVTPSQRHDGRHVAILARRDEVYRQARQRHPERWTRSTRNWSPVEIVRLNPVRRHRRSDGPAANHNATNAVRAQVVA
jgi:transposase InsO family protein